MEIVAGVLVVAVSLGFAGLVVGMLIRYGAPPYGVAERWRRVPPRSRVLFVVCFAVYLAVGVLLARAAGG